MEYKKKRIKRINIPCKYGINCIKYTRGECRYVHQTAHGIDPYYLLDVVTTLAKDNMNKNNKVLKYENVFYV